MKYLSQIMSTASGSVNGLTASHNRGGQYFRKRVIPADPSSARQIAQRARFSAAVVDWTETLTPAERSSWDLYAENVPVTDVLGQQKTLSGQQWYIGSATTRNLLGLDPVNTAPGTFDRGEFTTPISAYGLGAGANFQINNSDVWANEDDAAMAFFQGRPQNASRNFYKGPWRFIGVALGDSTTPPATNQQFVTPPFEPVIGSNQWSTVLVARADGRFSTRRVLGPVVTIA